MNDVPLVKANNIHDINTSIIAIKKQLKQLNEAVGLIDMPTIDTSIFVKKSEVVDVVEEGNMNPVTSNAVVPVDEVTSGNMQSVTSNAVANAMNYSTSEVNTGKKWVDGKDIYRITLQSIASDIGNNTEERLSSILIDKNVDEVVTLRGFIGFYAVNRIVPIPNNYIFLCYNISDKYIYINNGFTSISTNVGVTLIAEYTKTTD